MQLELITIIQMNSSIQNELQQTKASFFKLQDNFNHNLLVIEQQEQEIDRLLKQVEDIRYQLNQQKNAFIEKLEEAESQNREIKLLMKSQIQKIKMACDQENQHIIQMMNEKMYEQKKFQRQKIDRQKKQLQAQIHKYQQAIKHHSLENAKLLETIKQLRFQRQSMEEELNGLLAQKQNFANKFTLHQKQLENIKNASEEWEVILKQKIKDANKEKQRLQEELSELKLSFKMKLKSVKEEASKKIEQIESSKEKILRNATQDAKQIKLRYESNLQELEKLKNEFKNLQKQKAKTQEKLKDFERQSISDKQVEYLKKIFEQEKMQLKSQNKLIQHERNQLKQQLKTVNQRRQEAEKTLERVKTALISSQKENSDSERKIKKLEREIRQIRAEAKRMIETTQIHFKGFPNQDNVIQNQNSQNQQNLEYSKYFSEDMGPPDQMFLMQNSVPKSPKNFQPTNPLGPNHQMMKKIGELQVEIQQYKSIIKTMTQQLQRAKGGYLDQISLKDQQIKLSRDEIHFLRQRINEREHQLLNLNTLRQQLDEKTRKLNQMSDKLEESRKQSKNKENTIQKLEESLKNKQDKIRDLEENIKRQFDEKNMLEEINQQLRAQIHKLKLGKNISQQIQRQSSEQQQQEFQVISHMASDASQVGHIRRDQRITQNGRLKSRSKTKSSKSKSGGKYTKNTKIEANKSGLKLKDLVLKKRQLELQGRKMKIDVKQPQSQKNVETKSQKQIFNNLRKKSIQKQRDNNRAERLKVLDYDRIMGRKQFEQLNDQF